MSSVKLHYQGEIRKIEAPPSLQHLLTAIQATFNIYSPTVSYTDEDGDIISIQTEQEYQNAIEIHQNACIRLNVTNQRADSNGSRRDFIDQLPITESEIMRPPPEMQEKAVGCVQMQADVGVDAQEVEQKEQGCMAMQQGASLMTSTHERVEQGTGMEQKEQKDMGCGLRVEDKATDSVFVDVSTIGQSTDPVYCVNQALETVPFQVYSKSSGTNVEMNLMNIQECISQIISDELQNHHFIYHRPTVTHHGINCSECGMSNIQGPRFFCPDCAAYNICSKCEQVVEHEHNLLKLKKQAQDYDHYDFYFNTIQLKPQGQLYPWVGPPEKRLADGTTYKKKRVDECLEKLQEAGFSDNRNNIEAILKANYNIERAFEILIEKSNNQ